MLNEYYKDTLNAREAKEELQKLTFYPMMFQASRVIKNTGVLNEVYLNKRKGIFPSEVAEKLNLPLYGVTILLETGLTIGLTYLKKNESYSLTKMGYHLLFDEATKVNLNFTHDVCYKALFHLEDAILSEKPAGLMEIGVDSETIYPYLSQLDDTIKKSWFDFDHYYSDRAFPEALKVVFEDNPTHIVDIGGNTGKWSIACCEYSSDVRMTIVDLPGQWGKAKENIISLGLQDRVKGQVGDVLSKDLKLPEADAIWMSQFLDCFSKEQVVHILTNICNNMADDTFVYIQDLYWDRQKDFSAAYSLHGTSLYFTAVANGNSKMYHSRDMLEMIEAANLEVIMDVDEVGKFHTIMKCKKITS